MANLTEAQVMRNLMEISEAFPTYYDHNEKYTLDLYMDSEHSESHDLETFIDGINDENLVSTLAFGTWQDIAENLHQTFPDLEFSISKSDTGEIMAEYFNERGLDWHTETRDSDSYSEIDNEDENVPLSKEENVPLSKEENALAREFIHNALDYAISGLEPIYTFITNKLGNNSDKWERIEPEIKRLLNIDDIDDWIDDSVAEFNKDNERT